MKLEAKPGPPRRELEMSGVSLESLVRACPLSRAQSSGTAVSLDRNPRIRGAESRFRRRQHTADQIAAASPDPPACTLSRHVDTYGAQLKTN